MVVKCMVERGEGETVGKGTGREARLYKIEGGRREVFRGWMQEGGVRSWMEDWVERVW